LPQKPTLTFRVPLPKHPEPRAAAAQLTASLCKSRTATASGRADSAPPVSASAPCCNPMWRGTTRRARRAWTTRPLPASRTGPPQTCGRSGRARVGETRQKCACGCRWRMWSVTATNHHTTDPECGEEETYCTFICQRLLIRKPAEHSSTQPARQGMDTGAPRRVPPPPPRPGRDKRTPRRLSPTPNVLDMTAGILWHVQNLVERRYLAAAAVPENALYWHLVTRHAGGLEQRLRKAGLLGGDDVHGARGEVDSVDRAGVAVAAQQDIKCMTDGTMTAKKTEHKMDRQRASSVAGQTRTQTQEDRQRVTAHK